MTTRKRTNALARPPFYSRSPSQCWSIHCSLFQR